MSHNRCSNSLDEGHSPIKRGRGRPAKYSPEEREQKYRESIDKWREDHKEKHKNNQKRYYEQHSEQLIKQKKDYYEISAYALRLLNDMWSNPDLIEIKSEDLRNKLENLIKHKRISAN